MASINYWTSNNMAPPKDEQFYVELGQRIAEARKAHGFTQTQLAEILGISQQTMANYEAGNLRIAVSMLLPLIATLEISIEDLLGLSQTSKSKRGPLPKLQKQVEQISNMPRTKQKLVIDVLDAIIQQQSVN